MLTAINGHIGIAPFAKGKQLEKVMVGGMMTVAQGVELASAEVIIGSKDIPAGSVVYFDGKAPLQGWAKARHTINGKEILQAPENQVLFVDVQMYTWTGPIPRVPPTPMASEGV